MEELAACDSDDEMERPRKKPKMKRQRWSEVEENEIKKYFATFLDSKTTPRSKQVEKAKKKSKEKGGEIHKRACHLIIKKISAINHRK